MAGEKGISIRDLWAALRRRRTIMLVTAAAVTVAATLLAFIWPATYRATGTILIESQELPVDLVRSTITSYADQRIQVITQRVMTTENLFQIMQKYDLYADKRKKKPREVIIAGMRDDIDFKMISADVIDPRSGNPTKATIAFTVSYDNRNPVLTARVANELVSLYLQQNIENRKQRSADATAFLNEEAARLGKSIESLQAEISNFKQAHINELPELSQLNIQLMNRADDELREVDTRVRSLDQQIVYLDAQLAQISPSSQVYTSTGERVLSPSDRLKFLRTEYARVSGIYSADHPDVLRLKSEIAGLEQNTGEVEPTYDLQRQLAEAKTQLAAAREKYSADHPDVLRLERLSEHFAAKLEEAKSAPAKEPASIKPDNPAYIQIQAQREASNNERHSLLDKREQLKAQVVDFEKRLAATPEVEREYMAIAREMENNQLKYREVRQKQMEAQVAQNLEEDRKGERFTLIEPPLTPEKPASPNRMLLLVLGVMMALGGAVGIGALLEALDSTVRNRRDLELLVDVPPLAILPLIETKAQLALRARLRRYSFAGATAGLLIVVALVHWLYRPLDVLWQVALRRLTG